MGFLQLNVLINCYILLCKSAPKVFERTSDQKRAFLCLYEILAFRGADAQSDGVPNRAEGRLCKRITFVIFLLFDSIYYFIVEKTHCNHKRKFR